MQNLHVQMGRRDLETERLPTAVHVLWMMLNGELASAGGYDLFQGAAWAMTMDFEPP